MDYTESSRPTRDRTLRFCANYDKRDAGSKRDSYPIPRMDKRMGTLGKETFFSTLNASSEY